MIERQSSDVSPTAGLVVRADFSWRCWDAISWTMHYLMASDDALIAQCEVDRYRASGPGGQHRNKTDSAVRLRHRLTGVTAIGEDSRSQAENKIHAVRRLRAAIALTVREPVSGASARLRALVAGGTAPLGAK